MDDKILAAKLYRACLDSIMAMGKDEFLKSGWFAFKKSKRKSTQVSVSPSIKSAA